MKILSSKAHGIIDYIFILFLAASPALFKTEGSVTTIIYALAAVHFLMTILTDFETGIFKMIPFRIHGIIELVVAIGLGSLSLWYRGQGNTFAFWYFVSLAIVILLVFNLTDFRGAKK